MLQYLDTAIAFAVIILMLSLLITAVVQMILSALDLRGRNLAWHVEILLKQIYPGFRKTLQQLHTEMQAADLNIEAPGQKTKARSAARVIAEAVVCHPAVSQGASNVGRWAWSRNAKAISSDELMAVLQDLNSDDPAAKLEAKAKYALQQCFKEHVDASGQTFAMASAVEEQLKKQFPQIADQIKNLINESARKVTKVEQGVEQWFDTIMNRSGDLFLRYTRVITVGAAVVMAVIFQIDVRQIAQQLYTNTEVRDSFVKMADATIAQADKVFDNSKRGGAALKLVANNEKTALETAKADLAAANSKTPVDPTAVKEKQQEVNKHDAAVTLLSRAQPDLENCSSARAWLSNQILQTQDKEIAAAFQSLEEPLNNACQDVTLASMGIAGEQIKDIKKKLDQSDLKLIGIGDSYLSSLKDYRHLLGILGTIVLLSLGAPFWFNMLEQLVKLKPIVASKVASLEADGEPVEAEAATAKKKAAAGGK